MHLRPLFGCLQAAVGIPGHRVALCRSGSHNRQSLSLVPQPSPYSLVGVPVFPQLRRTAHQSDPARPGYRRRHSRRDPAGGRPIAVLSDQSADAMGEAEDATWTRSTDVLRYVCLTPLARGFPVALLENIAEVLEIKPARGCGLGNSAVLSQ